MKKFLALLFFCARLAAKNTELQPGENYDFLATDGQHLYDATLVKETRSAYIVRLADLGDEPLTIEKKILSGPPRKSMRNKSIPVAADIGRGHWQLGVSGGFFVAGGALAGYVQYFPGVTLSVGRSFTRLPYLGVNSLRATGQYMVMTNSPRRIDAVTVALGPQWGMTFQRLPKTEFWFHAAPALSLLKYNSYTFDLLTTTPGALAALGADWQLARNVALTVSVGAQYLYDQSTVITLYTANTGVTMLW